MLGHKSAIGQVHRTALSWIYIAATGLLIFTALPTLHDMQRLLYIQLTGVVDTRMM